MTTSGTTRSEAIFPIDDIVKEAYNRVGLDSVSGYQLRSARRSLDIMFMEWANRGLHYWEIEKTNLDLVEGQAEYKFFRDAADGTSATTSPTNGIHGVDDVLEAAYRTGKGTTNQSDSALTKINRSTYSGLSNKLTKGQPTQYYVQRFIDNVTITLYPTPDATAAANDVALYFVKRIQDGGLPTNVVDVPYRFVPCMVSGLAYYLSQKVKPEMVQQMKLLYEDELQRALTEDGSSSSTFITPQAYYPNV
jgi:hypothetical protein|tara:strand:+ start:29 stop:775 length:747 start_codon:yes stop_codon:yes gene_type:complete